MDAIGWSILVGVVLFLPLLPVLVLVWLVVEGLDALTTGD